MRAMSSCKRWRTDPAMSTIWICRPRVTVVILREHLSFRDGILDEIASGCWEEYIACRLSAFMGKEAVEEIVPRAINRIDSQSYFKRFFARLHDELRALRGSYGSWQSLEVFEPLKTLADDLLKIGGIDIRPRPGRRRSCGDTS